LKLRCYNLLTVTLYASYIACIDCQIKFIA